MKKYTKIFVLSILIVLNACSAYKDTDLDYFETTAKGLEQAIDDSEASIQMQLKYLEAEAVKKRGVQELVVFVKESYALIKKTTFINKNIHKSIEDLEMYANKDESYKYYSALSLLDNLDSTNQAIQNYLDFLVENYANLLEAKTKQWHQNTAEFLEKELRALPLYGGISKLRQIQYHFLQETQKIILHLLKKSKNFMGTHSLHLHLKAEKNKVKLGEDYKANISFLNIPTPEFLEMTIDGQKLKVENGIGKLRFNTQGLGKKTHTIEIKTKNYFGRDTSWKIEEAYPIYEVIPKQ